MIGFLVFRVLKKELCIIENLCARQSLGLLKGCLDWHLFPLRNFLRKKNLVAFFYGEVQASGTLDDLTDTKINMAV